MWYLFNSERQCIGTISGEPNHEDLATRDEKAVESDLIIPISEVGIDDNGKIIQIILPPPSVEENQKTLNDAVQAFIDQTAQERGYNDMVYLTSYSIATNNDKWAAEAIAGANWRNEIWTIFNDTMRKAHGGEIPFPDTEEFISSLPRIIWPETTPDIPIWIQPEGAHDAYQMGAMVLHNGKTYISDIDNNIWNPEVFGWTEWTET